MVEVTKDGSATPKDQQRMGGHSVYFVLALIKKCTKESEIYLRPFKTPVIKDWLVCHCQIRLTEIIN